MVYFIGKTRRSFYLDSSKRACIKVILRKIWWVKWDETWIDRTRIHEKRKNKWKKKPKAFRKQKIVIAVWKVTFRTMWECNKSRKRFSVVCRPFFGVSWSNSKTSKNQLACANICPFFIVCFRLPNVSFSFFFAKRTLLQVYNKHIIFKSTRI